VTQDETDLFETSGSEAIDAQHECGSTDESGGYEKYLIVNLWDCAQYETDDGACFSTTLSKREQREMEMESPI
jgi:hypothetical protein